MQSVITALFSGILLASAALAQAVPAQDSLVAGVWKMLPEKSDFGPMPTPDHLTLTVRVNGPVFEVDQASPDGIVHFTFRSDKQEAVNRLPDGSQMKSRHWVEGAAVRGEIVIGQMTMKDRISYSADGRLMSLDRDISSPEGESKMKIVLEKAAPPKPSMAGYWKLDGAKSDFGGPAPSKFEASITVDGPLISMQQRTEQIEVAMKVRDDGQETTNEVGGMTMKSKMWWEQATLVGEHVYSGNGVEFTFKDKTTFSPDGKVMTMDRVGRMPNGERKVHIVMVKQ